MSDLAERVLTTLTALGGSAAFLEILRRWLQRRQDKRQEQLQLDVRILEEGHALRQEAYQREREALQALAEERERRHKVELLALQAQLQAKLEALTRINEDLVRRLSSSPSFSSPRNPEPHPPSSPAGSPASALAENPGWHRAARRAPRPPHPGRTRDQD